MASIFDMNAKHICKICLDSHPVTTKCSYDLLVHYVHTHRLESMALMNKLKESVQVAKDFQNIIRSIEPELVRLVAVELKYKKLVGEDSGTKELHAQA